MNIINIIKIYKESNKYDVGDYEIKKNKRSKA